MKLAMHNDIHFCTNSYPNNMSKRCRRATMTLMQKFKLIIFQKMRLLEELRLKLTRHKRARWCLEMMGSCIQKKSSQPATCWRISTTTYVKKCKFSVVKVLVCSNTRQSQRMLFFTSAMPVLKLMTMQAVSNLDKSFSRPIHHSQQKQNFKLNSTLLKHTLWSATLLKPTKYFKKSKKLEKTKWKRNLGLKV